MSKSIRQRRLLRLTERCNTIRDTILPRLLSTSYKAHYYRGQLSATKWAVEQIVTLEQENRELKLLLKNAEQAVHEWEESDAAGPVIDAALNEPEDLHAIPDPAVKVEVKTK